MNIKSINTSDPRQLQGFSRVKLNLTFRLRTLTQPFLWLNLFLEAVKAICSSVLERDLVACMYTHSCICEDHMLTAKKVAEFLGSIFNFKTPVSP